MELLTGRPEESPTTASLPIETQNQKRKLIDADNHSPSALEEDILTLLFGRKLYGRQISQAIEKASGGKQILHVGSLYPTLSRLEKKGFIQGKLETQRHPGRGGARKRYYQITPLGANVLTERQKLREKLAEWNLED